MLCNLISLNVHHIHELIFVKKMNKIVLGWR